MAEYEYVVERHPSGDVHATLEREQMLARVDGFVKRSWLIRLRRRGEPWSRWLFRPLVKQKIRRRTHSNYGDPKLFIQRQSDMQTLSIHKVEGPEKIPDLGCAPELERIHAAVWGKFGSSGVRSGGRYFCRFVDGTRIVSRHGYRSDTWQGAAEDIFSMPDNMDALRVRANFIVSETQAGRLNARTVIVGDDVWTPSTGWQPYGGVYHTHVHVDVEGGFPCMG